MTTLTGASGALRFNGKMVAKVRQYEVSLNRDALDESCIS